MTVLSRNLSVEARTLGLGAIERSKCVGLLTFAVAFATITRGTIPPLLFFLPRFRGG